MQQRYPNLTQSPQWQPVAIAVDSVTDNIYVLDAYTKSLSVFDAKTAGYGIVISDINNPTDFALDTFNGFIFILQKYNSVSGEADFYLKFKHSFPLEVNTTSKVKRNRFCFSGFKLNALKRFS